MTYPAREASRESQVRGWRAAQQAGELSQESQGGQGGQEELAFTAGTRLDFLLMFKLDFLRRTNVFPPAFMKPAEFVFISVLIEAFGGFDPHNRCITDIDIIL